MEVSDIVDNTDIRNETSTLLLKSFVFIIMLTVPVRMVLHRYNMPIAPQVFWTVYAIGYGVIVREIRRKSDLEWLPLDWTFFIAPQWLIAFYFPAMGFRMAYKVDLHIMKRSWSQVFFISIIASSINAVVLGTIMRFTLYSGWTVPMGILFGAVCSFTEPSDNVQMMNEMDKYKHLITVMEGESLIGLCFGMILVELMIGYIGGAVTAWYQILIIIVRMIVLSVIVGMILGFLAVFMLARLHNDRLSVLGTSLVATYLAYYLTTSWMGSSGSLASVVVGLRVAKERARLGADVDLCLVNFWDVIVYLMRAFLYVGLFGICLERMISGDSTAPTAQVVMTYFLASLTRFSSFLIISPILSRIGYGLDFKSMIFLMWAPQKSLISLIMGLTIFHDVSLQMMAIESISNICSYVVLTFLINNTTVTLVLKLLGFSQLSLIRKTNMNNCMKFIMEKRVHILALLKMNRFLSDANWPLVQEVTMMKHPYKLKELDSGQNEEDDFLWGARASFCPECEIIVQIEPTPKELVEMTREARLRVLKSEKISYIRQYEKGLLSQEGIRSLLQSVEVAIDSHDLVIKLDDYFKIIKKRNFYDVLKDGILKIIRKGIKERLLPKKHYRRMCYYIMNHVVFELVYATIILSHVLFECTVMILRPIDDDYLDIDTLLIIFQAFCCLYQMIYLIKIYMKMLALSYIFFWKHGVSKYFRQFFDIFEFAQFTLSTISLIITICLNYSQSEEDFIKFKIFHVIYYYLVWSKIVYFLRIIKYLGPTIIRYCENRYDTRIAYAYEIGHALVTSYEEVTEMLTQMVNNKSIRDQIFKQLEVDRLAVTRELGLMHKYSPWIAVSTKTRQAINATLNHINQTITDLKISGFVDTYEFTSLQESIEDRMRALRNLKRIDLSSPKALFKEIQWLASDENIADFLYENVNTRIWDAGDIICENGRETDGLFILVTGLFKLSYKPDSEFLKKRQNTGELPVVDYMASIHFENSFQDYIFAGNSIGEICSVTKRPYNCSIIAEVPSQAFILSPTVLQQAMLQDRNPLNGLECRMWKYISINIAISILQDTPVYQSFTQDQIRMVLENAFMPNLSGYTMFVVTEQMADVVLIEGIVLDYNTRDSYVGPCYLPRTVQKFITPKSQYFPFERVDIETKLLILPAKDVGEYELMEKAEELAEVISIVSSSCLLNAEKKRNNRRDLFPVHSTIVRSMGRGVRERDASPFGNRQSSSISIVFDYKNRSISTHELITNTGYSKAHATGATQKTHGSFILGASKAGHSSKKDE